MELRGSSIEPTFEERAAGTRAIYPYTSNETSFLEKNVDALR